GGLITKRDSKTQTGVPVLGDLPVVGSIFRYRTKTHTRQELMVILTPHVVRGQIDYKRILEEETARLRWNLNNVAQVHGHGIESMMPPVTPRTSGPDCLPPSLGLAVPAPHVVPGPRVVPPPA